MKKLIAALRHVVATKPADDPGLKSLVKTEIDKLTKSPKMKELIEKMALRYNISTDEATKILFHELGTGFEESTKKTAASIQRV